MTDINLGLAFANYLSNAGAETVEAIVPELERRPDLLLSGAKSREALTTQISAGAGGLKPAKAEISDRSRVGAKEAWL
ncbi:MAG: hypothetical protein EOP74_00160 [Variovorax sp.]|nr:MAG: hypothetical protein EOP74_00160 [Variovorax sp.]